MLSSAGGHTTSERDLSSDANCADLDAVGAIAMNAGTTINAGSGTITMSAPGNIALTGLSTTNNSAAAVSVSSSAGAITDAGDTTTDITAAGAAAGTGERRGGEEWRARGAPYD